MATPQLIITIAPPARTYNVNALQIGGNIQYINDGLMRHELTNIVVPQLQAMFQYFLEHQPASALGIAIPGYVLDLLAKHEEQSLAMLHSFLKEHKVSLLAVPYYGSSVALLDKEELTHQLALQDERFKKLFKRKPAGFFAADNMITPELEATLNEAGYKTVFMAKDDTELSLTKPAYALKQVTVVDISAFIDNKNPEVLVTPMAMSLAKATSEMEQHLVEELKNMYPFIKQSGDATLLDDWRFLAQSNNICQANTELFPAVAYEQYTGMMNILNDIAHRIRNVELTKQGVFAPDPQIVASPTKLLHEFFSDASVQSS